MIALLFLLLTFSATIYAQTGKPNVIIIFTDDMGYADLSSQKSVNDVKTPNIDLLAKEGIRFTNGYCTAPQCSPSRAGLITGRYQQRFGLEEIADCPLPLEETTLADRLARAGYVNGMVGKWHLEPNAISKIWLEKNAPHLQPDKAGRYRVPDSLTFSYMPGERGFHEYYCGEMQRYRVNYDLKGNSVEDQIVTHKEFRVDVQTEAALSFINRNHEKPFFLYLAYFAPHVPLEATQKYLERFPGPMPERRRYALAMISAMDDGVGRIKNLLKEYGIDENTMIIFTSDNGAPLKLDKQDLALSVIGGAWDGSLNDPLLGEKGMLTEGGIRVPFVISWKKGLPQGKVYDHPVSTLDIAATAVAMANLPSQTQLDGVNLLPYLTGVKTGSPHDYLYWRFWTQSAIRHGKWKYIKAGNHGEYLFDLDNDMEETTNLLKKYPQVADQLHKQLEKWSDKLIPTNLPENELKRSEQRFYNHYFKP